MEGGKKMLCLGIFSTRHKHTKNLCLWNSSVFGVCWEYWNGWSNFLLPGILLCAVSEVNKLPLNFSAKKKQFIDCNHWLNPEIVCTIFLHPLKGWWALRQAQGDSPSFFDWETDRVNYYCTGGWKSVAQKGCARCKESILHNATL